MKLLMDARVRRLAYCVLPPCRCESLASDMEPWRFDACGLLMVEERGMPWYGDDTVIPSEAWPNVTGFLNDVVGVSEAGLGVRVGTNGTERVGVECPCRSSLFIFRLLWRLLCRRTPLIWRTTKCK